MRATMQAGDGRQVRTLVVDDENSVRVLLESVLSRAGHQVVVVETAEAGLAELERQPFQLVITDKHLPGLDGFEFFQRARAIRPSIQGILITAFPTAESQGQATEAGLYAYVIKPFQVSDVLAVCEGAIKLAGGGGLPSP